MFVVQYLSVKCAVLMHLSFTCITRMIDFGVVCLQGRTGPPGRLAKARWAGAAVGRFDKNDNRVHGKMLCTKYVDLNLRKIKCVEKKIAYTCNVNYAIFYENVHKII